MNANIAAAETVQPHHPQYKCKVHSKLAIKCISSSSMFLHPIPPQIPSSDTEWIAFAGVANPIHYANVAFQI